MRSSAPYAESRYVTATVMSRKPLAAAETITSRIAMPLGTTSPTPSVVMEYPLM